MLTAYYAGPKSPQGTGTICMLLMLSHTHTHATYYENCLQQDYNTL